MDIKVHPPIADPQFETAIAIDPDDPEHIVCLSIQRNWPRRRVAYYTTLDGGATWSVGLLKRKAGLDQTGDPALVVLPGGTVVAITLHISPNGLYSYRSVDGGLTWKGPKEVAPPDPSASPDKPQIAADLGPGPQSGDVAVVWHQLMPAPIRNEIFISTTSDRGVSWSTPLKISAPSSTYAFSPDVAYGPNSELYVMWADQPTSTLWFNVSHDGGFTWSGDQQIDTYVPVKQLVGASLFVNEVFSLEVDRTLGPFSGTVYLATYEWDAALQSADVMCRTSSSGGLSWSNAVPVHTGPGADDDQIYPVVKVDRGGNANVTYYHRTPGAPDQMWTYLARSADGGQTFQERRVSDQGFNLQNVQSIGEYIDLDTSANEVVPVWMDNRDGDLDVFIDRVTPNFAADLDQLSAATGGRVEFTTQVGPNHAGDDSMVLGSWSGTTPGLDLGNGVIVPLNWDSLTWLMFGQGGAPFFQNARATLDATGGSVATLDTAGPFSVAFVGLDLDFAVLVSSNGRPVFATNPTRVSIVP